MEKCSVLHNICINKFVPEALVAHNQQQELAAQQASNAGAQVTVSPGQPTHQQVPNNRVEFVQHHNIDMVNHVVTHSVY